MLTFFMKLLFGSTILLLAALVLSLVLRKTSATIRHRIWAGSLVGLLMLPLVSPLLPSWSPFRVREIVPEPVAAQDVLPSSEPVVAVTPVHDPVDLGLLPMPRDEFQPVNFDPSSAAVSARQPYQEKTPIRYDLLILAIVSGGTLFLLLKLVFSIRKVAQELDRLDLQKLPTSRRRTVWLAKSDRAAVPFTCRIRRPVIVLPDSYDDWSEPQKNAVLAHELAHIARNDVFWQIFSQAMCAVYWFHPLLWLAAWRMRVERELACDDLVLLGGEKPSMYAELLLHLASGIENRHTRLLGCMVAMAREQTVKTRIKAILNPNICRRQPGRVAAVLMLCLAVIGITFAATISPFAKTREMTEQEKEQSEHEKHLAAMAKIAIPEGAQAIPVKGKVLMPDGSPAVFCRLELTCMGIHCNPRQGTSEPSYSTRVGNTNSSSDRDGLFTMLVPRENYYINHPCPGENVLIYGYAPQDYPNLVSDPIVFVAREDQEEFTIQLREGIPVRGRVLYADGTPATGRTVSAKREITPPLGADLFNEGMSKQFAQEFQAKIDDNGEYVIYLTEGEFQIKEFDSTETKTIHVAADEPKTNVDFELPTPFRGKLVAEDGEKLEHIRILKIKDQEMTSLSTHSADPEHEFTITDTGIKRLIVTTMKKDQSLGAIYDIPEETYFSETHTITLKSTATVKIRFLGKQTGTPIVGENCSACVVIKREGHTSSRGVETVKTDETGTALLRLPEGTQSYTLICAGWDLEKKDLTLISGETLDLGTIKIENPSTPDPAESNRQAELARIAVPKGTKAVPIRGKILMPDGSPAGVCQLEMRSLEIRSLSKQGDPRPVYTPILDVHMELSERDGRFIIPKPMKNLTHTSPRPGENILLYASTSKGLVSDPIVFVAREDQEEITVQLREGIPVRGRVLYADGSPAKGRYVTATRAITPLIGAEMFDKDIFTQEFRATIDDNGEYVFYLTEGEYQIHEGVAYRIKKSDSTETKTVRVAADEPEKTFDFELPLPFRGKPVSQNGEKMKDINIQQLTDQGFHPVTLVFAPALDEFTIIDPNVKKLVMTSGRGDERIGIAYDIPEETRYSETHTITLKPFATVRIRLVDDETGEPICDKKIGNSYLALTEDGASVLTGYSGKTDETGTTLIRLPEGTDDYVFKCEKLWTLEKKDLTLTSGETIDLGTFRVRQTETPKPEADASDFERRIKAETLKSAKAAYENALAALNGDFDSGTIEQQFALFSHARTACRTGAAAGSPSRRSRRIA